MGEAALAQVVAEARGPVVGIGGVTLARVPTLRALGVHAVAVIADVNGHADPAGRARQFSQVFA